MSAPDQLEACLLRINRFGEPMLTRMSKGWWCKVPLSISIAGATFEVQSEAKHATPGAAAAECEARIIEALRALGTINPGVAPALIE